MKVKFLNTTNNLAVPMLGQTVELRIGDMAAGFEFDPELIDVGIRFDYRRGHWSTSTLKNIKYDEVSRDCYNITITTRNSEYVFQKGEKSDTPVLTEDEILAYQMAMIF